MLPNLAHLALHRLQILWKNQERGNMNPQSCEVVTAVTAFLQLLSFSNNVRRQLKEGSHTVVKHTERIFLMSRIKRRKDSF